MYILNWLENTIQLVLTTHENDGDGDVVCRPCLGRSPTLRGAMAPHENLFFVEKHYNDSLYRGQRKGTTHTDREIQAAANLLGRRGVVADERAALARDARASTTSASSACARAVDR